MQFVFIFFICLIASTVGSICGIGGGVVIKPVLDSLDVMTVSTVSFLSGLTVLSMAIISVYRNRHSSHVDGRRSLFLGIGGAVGGIAGKAIFDLIKTAVGHDAVLGIIQSVLLALLLLGTAAYMLVKAKIPTKDLQNPAACILIGLALGLLSSFLGIGGGPMNLVVLYYFFSMDTKKAAVNSLIIILLSQFTSFVQTVALHKVPAFEWPVLILMVTAGILGGMVGTKIHRRLSVTQTERLFFGLLAVIFVICLFNIVRYAAA